MAEQVPGPEQAADPAEEFQPVEYDKNSPKLGPNYNDMLTGFAGGIDPDAVPTAEQFDQARALASGLKAGDSGYRRAKGSGFVNQEAAEKVAAVADESRWRLDEDAEAQQRGIADAKHVTELSDDERARLGKVDAMEPGSSILHRAHAQANARLALHEKLQAEDVVREAEADVVRGEKMQAEKDRVYQEAHDKHMAGAERGIQDKVNEIMGRIDPNNAEAQRLRPSTEAKVRARFEQEAAREAHAKASAAADAREAYINENGGIDKLDVINYQDHIGVKRDKAEEKQEPDELVRPDNVEWKVWFATLPKDRPALIAEANARAAAEAEEAERARLAAEAATADDEADTADDEADTADDEASTADDEADTADDEADTADDEADTADDETDDLEVEPEAIPFWREAIDRWKRRRNRQDAGAAEVDEAAGDDAEDGEDDEEEVVIEADGTRVLVLNDPTPAGRRSRVGRMMDRARAYFHDPENGDRRRRRAVVGGVLGGVALAGGAALAYYLTRGTGGVESIGTALPFAKGTGEQVKEAARQHVEHLKSGSNPWDAIKAYYHSIGVKNPSNAKIMKLDEIAGKEYFAQHPELGHYSWAAWTRVATDLPVGQAISF